LPNTESGLSLPPGLDWEDIFGDDDEETCYDSNAGSGDSNSEQDSTPTPGNDLREPAYIHIDSASSDLGNFSGLSVGGFPELTQKDSPFYSLDDFNGIDPSMFLDDSIANWGVNPMMDYMNSAEFWGMDPMSEYNEHLTAWDWQGYDQTSVID
jgi:hypothetical protein